MGVCEFIFEIEYETQVQNGQDNLPQIINIIKTNYSF